MTNITDNSLPGDILTEEVIPHPISPYGESKIKAEEYILKAKMQEARQRIYTFCDPV